jgi:hypothetical protein
MMNEKEYIDRLWSSMDDSQKELLRILSENIITVGVRDSLRGGGIEEPEVDLSTITLGDIRALIPKSLTHEEKHIISMRVKYWLDLEQDKDWSLKKGYSRMRSNTRFKKAGTGESCEWPGCEEAADLVIDHRFPYSLGGDAEPENAGCLCKWHNLIKMNSPYSVIKWPKEQH